MIFKELVLRDLQHFMLGARFYLVLCLVVLVSVFSAVQFAKEFSARTNTYDQMISNEKNRLQTGIKAVNSFAQEYEHVFWRPSANEFVVSGNTGNFPNTFRMNIFSMVSLYKGNSGNYLLDTVRILDWTFIVGVILSFLAIILMYDSVIGERESGLIKLKLSQAVSRAVFITTKYCAGWLTIAIPFVGAFLLSLVIVNMLYNADMFFTQLPAMALFIFLSLVFLSLFILLGLLISCAANKSSTSLSIGLLVWVFWIILWPSMGFLIAKKYHPVSFEKYTEETSQARNTLFMNATPQASGYANYGDGKVYQYMDQRCKLINEIDKSTDDHKNNYWHDLLTVLEKARLLGRFSPAVSLQHILETIFNTGLPGFDRFYSDAKDYRLNLLNYVKELDRQDKESFHFVCSWHPETFSREKVDHAGIPVFRATQLLAVDVLSGTIFDVCYIIFLNIILFLGAYLVFEGKEL
jgi:ABC-type transport system involved in multi-copper enzyme maturation permease subunit